MDWNKMLCLSHKSMQKCFHKGDQHFLEAVKQLKDLSFLKQTKTSSKLNSAQPFL